MSKRIDGLIPRGIIKKHKGPSKELKTYSREPIQVSQGEINQYGFLLNDGLCRLLPVNDHNRYLLQANYWIANNNQFKARNILKGLGLKSKMIKQYIDEEISLQKRKPEQSGFNNYFQKDMPQEFIVRTN